MAQQQQDNTIPSSLPSSSNFELFANPTNDDNIQLSASMSISNLDVGSAGGSFATRAYNSLTGKWSDRTVKIITGLYIIGVFTCRLLLKSSYATQLDETTTACLQDLLALCPFVLGLILLRKKHESLFRPKPPPSPAPGSREPGLVTPAVEPVRPLGPEDLKLYLFAM